MYDGDLWEDHESWPDGGGEMFAADDGSLWFEVDEDEDPEDDD